MGDRHADVSPEGRARTWSLVLRMGQAGCLYHDRGSEFISIRGGRLNKSSRMEIHV